MLNRREFMKVAAFFVSSVIAPEVIAGPIERATMYDYSEGPTGISDENYLQPSINITESQGYDGRYELIRDGEDHISFWEKTLRDNMNQDFYLGGTMGGKTDALGLNALADAANQAEIDEIHDNIRFPESEGAFLDEMPGKRGR